MDESDAAAIARVRSGDAEAFGTLVERHSRSVFKLAFRMTGSEQDAEDVVQETFIRVYQQLDRYEARSSFSTWLYRVTANCAIDYVRTRRRHVSGHDSIDVQAEQGRDVTASDPTPDRLLWSSQIRTQVFDMLERLTPIERAAFVLRHFEGLSIDEIGGALELGESATKHSIFRAVRKMRRVLAPFAAVTS